MNTHTFIKMSLILTIFFGPRSFSQELNPKQLFLRCYSQLTGNSYPAFAGQAKLLESGDAAQAIQYCMNILNSANFDDSGTPLDTKGKPISDLFTLTGEYLGVIKVFQKLHLSFFRFQNIESVNVPGIALSSDVYDSETQAYYFTKALFQNLPLDYVVTTSDNLRANRRGSKRDSSYGNDPVLGPISNPKKADISFGTKIKFAPKGDLVGISEIDKANTMELGAAGDKNRDITAHRGGGILGSTPYLFSVQSRKSPIKPDGGLLRQRNFAKSVLNDFLCRDLPVVSEGDVNVIQNSKLTFETSKACYKCHASMDPLADTVGNISYEMVREGSCKDKDNKPVPCVGLQFVTQFNQNNKGALFYRDSSNVLYHSPVTGLDDLGSKLSQQFDFYLCTAKRYYSYFMGVDIKLGPGLIVNKAADPNLSQLEKTHVNNLISLSTYLKEGEKDATGKKIPGNLRGLVERIFNLPEYRKSDFGTQ
jgi:hypothetical protein